MGLKELFYNPYTKQEGKFGINGNRQIKSFPNHDDHLHIASDNADEMKQIMDVANNKYGLTVHENPYATKQGWDPDGVQPVHAKGSNHYRILGSGNIGGAADITGDKQKIFDFIDNYIYKEVYKDGKNLKPASSGGSLNNDLISKSKITTDDSDEMLKSDSGSSSITNSGDGGKGSSSFLGSIINQLMSKTLNKPLQEIVEPVSTTAKSKGSNYLITYKPLMDDVVMSPENGRVVKISKDPTSNKYTVQITHKIDNKKYISVLAGLENVSVSNGEKVSEGHEIGDVLKNNIITFKLLDGNGKPVDFDSLSSELKYKNKDKNRGKDSSNLPYMMQKAVNLNPINLLMKGAGALMKVKESTQENKVLTEEIQRIKNLMK